MEAFLIRNPKLTYKNGGWYATFNIKLRPNIVVKYTAGPLPFEAAEFIRASAGKHDVMDIVCHLGANGYGYPETVTVDTNRYMIYPL